MTNTTLHLARKSRRVVFLVSSICGNPVNLRLNLLRCLFLASFSLACASARAEIYDPPTSSPGGVRGNVTSPISAAVLVGANLTSIYNGTVAPDKRSFEFKGIPVGKYDILLFDEPADKTIKGAIYSGLSVTPGKADVPAQFADRFMERTRLNDKFFSRFNIAAFSFTEGNSIGLAVIERIKESPITHMDGTVQKYYLRRVELATMELAVDDWKTNTNRHVYRVEMPMETGKPFLDYIPVPALGRIRVVDSVKDLGSISLPAIP